MCGHQARHRSAFHLVDEPLSATCMSPNRVEISGLGDVGIGETGSGMPGVVTRELGARLDDQVIEVGRDSELPV